jgi:hypothetical protein
MFYDPCNRKLVLLPDKPPSPVQPSTVSPARHPGHRGAGVRNREPHQVIFLVFVVENGPNFKDNESVGGDPTKRDHTELVRRA